MEDKSKQQTGHSILTYRVRLYDRHITWLKATMELYGQVVKHFFAVLEKEASLLEQSDFLLLRALETRCIGTKEMKAKGVLPAYPLTGFPKVPLYFRRSAINTAIDIARKKAAAIQPNMVLYKGMYQNFTGKTIDLKLFTGENWVWVTYPFTGREFPEEAVKLSPMLVIDKKDAWLEVPLSFEVEDVRTVKERMQTEKRICAVSFPDNDVLAVAVIMTTEGQEVEHRFFRGGKAKEHKRKKLIERLRISEESSGTPGKKDATALRDLNNHYAHSISRQILNFCLEQNIKVIVVPNYETSIDFRDKKYLKTDAYRWLGRSIISKLKYKAFGQGIVVTTVRPYHITDCCSECGEKIRRYNEGHAATTNYYGGKLFVCPNGHRGNVAHNTAKNVAKNFLAYFSEEKETKSR